MCGGQRKLFFTGKKVSSFPRAPFLFQKKRGIFLLPLVATSQLRQYDHIFRPGFLFLSCLRNIYYSIAMRTTEQLLIDPFTLLDTTNFPAITALHLYIQLRHSFRSCRRQLLSASAKTQYRCHCNCYYPYSAHHQISFSSADQNIFPGFHYRLDTDAPTNTARRHTQNLSAS